MAHGACSGKSERMLFSFASQTPRSVIRPLTNSLASHRSRSSRRDFHPAHLDRDLLPITPAVGVFYFFRATLFDRNFLQSVAHFPVDRGRRQRNVNGTSLAFAANAFRYVPILFATSPVYVVRSVPTITRSTSLRCIKWPAALSAITVCGTPCWPNSHAVSLIPDFSVAFQSPIHAMAGRCRARHRSTQSRSRNQQMRANLHCSE